MTFYADYGDVLTMKEDGVLKLSFGQGRKSEEHSLVRGQLFTFGEPTKAECNVAFHISALRPSRRVLKRAYREQAARHCSPSFTELEMPEIGNPVARDIEARLAARGASLKQRLADAAAKLKG